MVSMSVRWLSEKLSAYAACGAPQSDSASKAGRSWRNDGMKEVLWVKMIGSLSTVRLTMIAVIYSFYWVESGLAVTMSSALTQPGEPTAKRVFAREASSRAVLLSPRRKAAWAEARSASA